MSESQYQGRLIKVIREILPGCIILKNDADYLQGIPDLLILYEDSWAALEVKAYEGAPEQPNQDYYIDEMDRMSFAAFIFPENEEEILDALQQSLRS